MIGTDIIEISRIEEAAKNPKFLARIFTVGEMEYIISAGSAPQTIAGLFAAKEAVSKAFGTGFSRGVSHQDIEITHDGYGAPKVKLHGNLQAEVYVSISHCKEYATATAIIKTTN